MTLNIGENEVSEAAAKVPGWVYMGDGATIPDPQPYTLYIGQTLSFKMTEEQSQKLRDLLAEITK